MGLGDRGEFSEIPILDVASLYGEDEEAIRATAATLRTYLEKIGFLYIVGHPIARADVEAVREASRQFFALSEEQKSTLKIDKNFRGYLAFAGSTIVTSSVAKVSKPNQSESIFFMHEIAGDDRRALAGEPLQGPNQWPDEAMLPGFKGAIERYVEAMGTLGRKMVGAIARSLDLPADSLDRYFEDPTTFLRLLHYPTQPREEGLFGSAPHTDYGFITLLSQDDVGGLEVKNKAGDWVPAPPVPHLQPTFCDSDNSCRSAPSNSPHRAPARILAAYLRARKHPASRSSRPSTDQKRTAANSARGPNG